MIGFTLPAPGIDVLDPLLDLGLPRPGHQKKIFAELSACPHVSHLGV
jgi:hypothetical protein